MQLLPRVSTTAYWKTWRSFDALASHLELTPWDRNVAWKRATGGDELWEWPVPMRHFLYDVFYVGEKVDVRPIIADFLADFADPDATYESFLFIAGVGSGKSYSAGLIIMYWLYLLSCMKKPGEYLRGFPGVKLDREPEIVLMNASGAGARQAAKIVYGEVLEKVDSSPYFQRYFPFYQGRSSELEFEHRIRFSPGTSEWRSALGWNVLGFVVDEAAFGIESERADYVAELWRHLDNRRRSRFGHLGFGGLFTSPGAEYGYVEELARNATDWDNSTLVRRTTTWEARGELVDGAEVFLIDVDPDSLRIVESGSLIYRGDGVVQRRDGSLIYYKDGSYHPPTEIKEAACA